MSANLIKNINWYLDTKATSNGEPGIYHSYMKCVATTINHLNGELDPVWLMGSSGFAFRIFVNEILCPSAMSVFDFTLVLPEVLEQAGYQTIYVSRYWDETDNEQARREMAQAEIITGIDNGIPAIVWDVEDAEWGLIIGYDRDNSVYHTLSHTGRPSRLMFDKLGQNGINILSVSIPEKKNNRSQEEIIRRALKIAVAHANQQEWTDRPEYQNGLSAYDLWAEVMEKAALLWSAGKANKVNPDFSHFTRYYAGHYYSARCYAREYLKSIAGADTSLSQAAGYYQNVATELKFLWDYFSSQETWEPDELRSLAQNLLQAKEQETEGIKFIEKYLAK